MPNALATKTATGGAVRWIDVDTVDETRVLALGRELPVLEERDLRECLPPRQRPKFVDRGPYQFLILLLPIYLRQERTIVTEEVDILLTEDAVATVHTGAIPVFRELHAAPPDGDARTLTLDILERLIGYCGPILLHLQEDIERQERRVGETTSEQDLRTAAELRRNVAAFRRTFLPTAHAIEHLRDALGRSNRMIAERCDRLVNQVHEILLLLEDFLTTIGTVHEAQRSLLTYRLNRAMTTLTVIAVLTFPLTLIATLFGMGAVATPLLGHPYDFWIIVGGLTTLALAMLAAFRANRLL